MLLDANEILAQIDELELQGKISDSIDLLRNSLATVDDGQLLKIRLAELLRKEGQQAEAWKLYHEGASTYAQAGELALATAVYKRMMSLDLPEKGDEEQSRAFRSELVQRYKESRSAHQDTNRPGANTEILLFQDLPPEALEDLVVRLNQLRFSPGQTVFREGEQSTGMYIITSGFVQVSRLTETGEDYPLARLGPGDFFGEWGLLSGERHRHASVTAITELSLLELNRETLNAIIEQYPMVREIMSAFYRRRKLDTLLSQVFPDLRPTERRRLAEVMEQNVSYPAGSFIFKEGDSSAFMSIIASGRVQVFTTDMDGGEVDLAVFGPGQFVGEGGALSGQRRTASVRALTDTVTHNVSREDLLTTLLNRPDVLQSLQSVRTERIGATLERLSELDDYGFDDFSTLPPEGHLEDRS